MQFISSSNQYARNVYVVKLEDDYERGLANDELITLVDNYGDRNRLESIILNGSHPGHFGGRVETLDNDTRQVTVYID